MSIDLRQLIKNLEQNNKLIKINKQVSCDLELGAILKKTKGKMPILFNNVKGYSIPVIGGICGDIDITAEFLGIKKDNILKTLLYAIQQPGEIKINDTAPCHQNIITEGINLKNLFPIPKFHSKDKGHFITGGIMLVKDAVSNRYITSIRRFQFQRDNILSVLIESEGLMNMYLDMQKQDKPLEFAILIGVHPVLTLTSQINSQIFKDVDKIKVASKLMNQPINLVKAKTIELEVPTETEIVLECKMIPNKRMKEGPFGELAGYYGTETNQPYAEVTAVTYKNNPIFQVIFPSSDEHKLYNSIMRELSLYLRVKHIVPSVEAVHVPVHSGGRFHAIISINKRFEGEGVSAILAAFSDNKDFKQVVVVNHDVNIFDPLDVEWAISTRVQADKDIIIIPRARGSGLDPSNSISGTSAKMGIDATYPIEYAHLFERSNISEFENIKLEDYL